LAELGIDERRGLLDRRERRDQFARHAFAADVEVAQRALGLCAPVMLVVDVDRPEAIALDSHTHVWGLPRARWRHTARPRTRRSRRAEAHLQASRRRFGSRARP